MDACYLLHLIQKEFIISSHRETKMEEFLLSYILGVFPLLPHVNILEELLISTLNTKPFSNDKKKKHSSFF